MAHYSHFSKQVDVICSNINLSSKKQSVSNKTLAKHRDIFCQKCNASARVQTRDLVYAKQTHYKLRRGD